MEQLRLVRAHSFGTPHWSIDRTSYAITQAWPLFSAPLACRSFRRADATGMSLWSYAGLTFAPPAAAFCLEPEARLEPISAATRPAFNALIKADGTVQETPAPKNLERRYDAWIALTSDLAMRRRLGRMVKARTRQLYGADSDAARRPWRLTKLPPARGRKTLPPFPYPKK